MARTSIDASLLASNIPSSKVTGTTTNDNAPSGGVGQYVSSLVTSAARFATAATGVYSNITSISVPAGDWDIVGNGYHAADGATVTSFSVFVSVNSGSSTADEVGGDNSTTNMVSTTSGSPTLGFPIFWRASFSTTTTVYLKLRSNFSAGTPTQFGKIIARRAR
jgi:hypothetical protein